jgi:hypothetical protein
MFAISSEEGYFKMHCGDSKLKLMGVFGIF